jgi:hypothetical protein
MLNRPSNEEYNDYYGRYVDMVPEGHVEEFLARQLEETRRFLTSIAEDRGDYRYGPDKWTVKEVIGHIADTERVMSYRLLRIARGDQTPLPGFNQDDFVQAASVQSCTLSACIEDYAAVRRATLTLMNGLSEEAWTRTGSASNSGVSARALAYIIAGHELHHLKVLRDKYLG